MESSHPLAERGGAQIKRRLNSGKKVGQMLRGFRVRTSISTVFILALVCACAAKGPLVERSAAVPEIDSEFTIAADSSEADLTPLSSHERFADLDPARLQSRIVRRRLLAPDRERWEGFYVLVRSAWRTDSARISLAGEFSVALSDITADSADLLVRASGKSAAYHTARIGLETPEASSNAAIVLVPTHWTISTGSYAGTTVRISARAVTARGLDRSRFARFHRADARAPWKTVGWRATDLPLALLFARDSAGPDIAPGDSAALWRAVRLLEIDLGAKFFRPAMSYEVIESDARVIVRIDPELHANGVTSVAWGPPANLLGVEVAFRSVRHLHDRAIAMHELLHTLGFGHTSSWYSLMRESPRRAGRATPEDVAYVQMLLRLRQLEASTGALHGLMAVTGTEH